LKKKRKNAKKIKKMQKTQKNAKTQKNVNFRGKKAKNLEKNSRFFLEN